MNHEIETEIAKGLMLNYKGNPKTAKTEKCRLATVRYLQLYLLYRSWL